MTRVGAGGVEDFAQVRELQQRGVAMTNRTVIGQAEGILMERLGIDADQGLFIPAPDVAD